MTLFSPKEKAARKYRRKFGPAITLGYTLTAGMLTFTLIGYGLDKKFGDGNNLWTLCGMLMGLFYCGYEVWKLVRTINEEDAKNSAS